MQFVWAKPVSGFKWGTTRDGDRQLRWIKERKGGDVDQYHPPLSLYRTFAYLRSPLAIQLFANDYGDILSVPGGEFYQTDKTGRRTIRKYARLSVWKRQIQAMRYSVELWDICDGETASEKGRARAREDLRNEIAFNLRDTLTPSCTMVRLSQELELFVYPANLIAFMWLTLGRLVAGEIAEQECVCGDYLYIGTGPGLKKTGTITCSPKCRKWKERNR